MKPAWLTFRMEIPRPAVAKSLSQQDLVLGKRFHALQEARKAITVAIYNLFKQCVRVVLTVLLPFWLCSTVFYSSVCGQATNPTPLLTNNTNQQGSVASGSAFDDPVVVDYWTFTAAPGQRLLLEVERQETEFDPLVWLFAGEITDQSHFVGGAVETIDADDPGFVALQDDGGAGPLGFFFTQDPRLSIDLTGPSTTYTVIVGSFLSGSEQNGSYELFDGGDGLYEYRIRAQVFTPAPPMVVGRHIFYNNSTFDGNNVNANAADDGAIATTKQAYLPGTGRAGIQSVTNYTRGINGIMVDIANMPGAPTSSDFEFRSGNSNATAAWGAPPAFAVASVTVRRDAGVAGSDRVTVLFADSSIRNQWLQVRVLPTANTGLATADVHFWGNATGDTSNSTNDVRVNGSDVSGVQANFTTFASPASIASPYDFNRDNRVNGSDVGIVQASFTNFNTALTLINIP